MSASFDSDPGALPWRTDQTIVLPFLFITLSAEFRIALRTLSCSNLHVSLSRLGRVSE